VNLKDVKSACRNPESDFFPNTKIDRPMVDALAAHEFAHIRRKDSAINLLQTIIEDLPFFNPAMWWVSKRVRAEREACCDDDAVAVCGNALVYVRALSQAEQNPGRSSPSIKSSNNNGRPGLMYYLPDSFAGCAGWAACALIATV
jgi:hypothetical protein